MINTLPMLSVAEARARLLERFHPLETESVPLEQAAGRVLAQAVTAAQDVPAFANSSMDGYAVRVADAAGAAPERPRRLPVAGDIPAGAASVPPLPPGTAMRIMTGAPTPAGAEAVVPVEDTDDRRDRLGEPPPAEVSIFRPATAEANIRPAGQDMRRGQTVLAPGAVLRPAAVGVLATLGLTQVSVFRRPRVAVISTGDELVEASAIPGPGQIRDSNSHALAAAALECGAEPLRLERAADRADQVRERLRQARALGADLILSSAGVSVGAYDVVKEVVQAEGRLDFWRVRMRPGKPVAFGQVGGTPFVGLPGNPVSALVTFWIFVRPAIFKLAGRARLEPLAIQTTVLETVRSDGRESYLRAVVRRRGAGYVARLTGDQGSAILTSLVRANGLLVVPEGVLEAPAGTSLPVLLLDGIETEIETEEAPDESQSQ